MPIPDFDVAAIANMISNDPSHAFVATPEQVAEAFASIDVDSTLAQWRSLLTVEIWDENSPINGVPVEVLRETHPELFATAEVGDVIMIKDPFGHVIQLQWHEPAVEGIVPVPKGDGIERGGECADRQCEGPAAVQMIVYATEQVRQAAISAGTPNVSSETIEDPWPDLPVVLL